MSSTHGSKKAPLAGAFFLVGPRQRGFSLVELVAVLVILGVLGAMAVPRLIDSPYAERGYAEQIAEALRYAHTVAVASGCPVRFRLDQFGYAVAQDNPANVALPGGAVLNGHCGSANTWLTVVRHADGSPLGGAPPNGVVVTGMPPAVLQIVFDSQGFVAAAAPVVIGAQTVTVQPSGVVVGP
jgi:MSHA pilin protein MshC